MASSHLFQVDRLEITKSFEEEWDKNMTASSRHTLNVGMLIVVIGAGGGLAFFYSTPGHGSRVQAQASGQTPATGISVKTIHPRLDKDFQITVSRPAEVEPYYRANLEAQVAGEVKWIHVARGSKVEKDQLLVRIHVPDKLALVREKANIVEQRKIEFELAQEKVNAANIAVKTALANVEEKRALLSEAKAQLRLRESQFKRLDELWRNNAVDKNARDEALKSLEYAQAMEGGADAARLKAEAEVEDARASVKVIEADLKRTKQLIEVAKSDHEQAAAIANYAEVKAPFKGAVVSRKVDPGSFVQNASTGTPTPMLSLERADIVTIVMNLPDNYAAHITPGTQAIIQLDQMPGTKIIGKVTRFSTSLMTAEHDRTMRVEVDLWNDSPELYRSFVADPKNLSDLKEGPLPIVPDFTGKSNTPESRRIITGKYANMTLILQTFKDIELIPSQAIIHRGGQTMIYVAAEGKAHLVPVEVQIDDGNLAKVVKLGPEGDDIGCLTCEEVIISNQEELSEGEPVATVLQEDWNGNAGARPSR